MLEATSNTCVIDDAILAIHNNFEDIYDDLKNKEYATSIYYHPFREKLLLRNPSIYSTKLCTVNMFTVTDKSFEGLKNTCIDLMTESITKYTELLFNSEDIKDEDLYNLCLSNNKISILDISDEKALKLFHLLQYSLNYKELPKYIKEYIWKRFKNYSGDNLELFSFIFGSDTEFLDNIVKLSTYKDSFMYRILQLDRSKRHKCDEYICDKSINLLLDKYKKYEKDSLVYIENLSLFDEDKGLQSAISYNEDLNNKFSEIILNVHRNVRVINTVDELLKEFSHNYKSHNNNIFAIKDKDVFNKAVDYINKINDVNKKLGVNYISFDLDSFFEYTKSFFYEDNNIEPSVDLNNKLLFKSNIKLIDFDNYKY